MYFCKQILSYESFRIFSDKLINEDDRKKFETILNKIFQLQWGKTTVLSNLKDVYFVPSEQYNNKQDTVALSRLNSEDWGSSIKKGIQYFGREGHTLNLLIIPELLNLVSAISRSLSQVAGCVLLAGRSGVGRHSSVRIVSALQSARIITAGSESLNSFKIELKLGMQVAGVEGEQVYFVVEDHVLRNNGILDLVNTFLAAGEVCNPRKRWQGN